MKKLYLLRHANSLMDQDYINDHARSISDLGRENALEVGAFLAAGGHRPEQVLCSTAIRARQTLETVMQAYDAPLDVTYRDKLYLAPPSEIFSQVNGLDENAGSAMLVGHNPGMHQFCLLLTGSGEGRFRKQLELMFPTCALAVFELPVEQWSDVVPGIGQLKLFLTPKLEPAE